MIIIKYILMLEYFSILKLKSIIKNKEANKLKNKLLTDFTTFLYFVVESFFAIINFNFFNIFLINYYYKYI
jgi:hypothetical protein